MKNWRNNKSTDSKSNSDSWLLTYGDMMTLLLCFFVLLHSFSVMDIEKFHAVISSFQHSLGIMDGGKTLSPQEMISGNEFLDEMDTEDGSALHAVYAEFLEFIEQQEIEDITFRIDERGLVISFADDFFFDIGSSKLNTEDLYILDRTAKFIKEINNRIRVEGHTCGWPIETERYPSNWELSVLRAANVTRYLIEERGVRPERMEASGMSKYKPLNGNETEKDRARNRRVEIVILGN